MEFFKALPARSPTARSHSLNLLTRLGLIFPLMGWATASLLVFCPFIYCHLLWVRFLQPYGVASGLFSYLPELLGFYSLGNKQNQISSAFSARLRKEDEAALGAWFAFSSWNQGQGLT